MSMYQQFQTDKNRERDGIVVDYGTFRVTVARAGGANKAFAKALDVATRPYQRVIAAEVMDNDKGREILIEVYAETIIKNWEIKGEDGKWSKGIDGPDGKKIPYKTENVIKVLKDLPDLFLDIKSQAESLTLYRESLREELGNA